MARNCLRRNATTVRVASARPATGPTYVTTATSTYDDHGRVTTATDALGNTTTTAYTPALGGPTTHVVTTTPGTDNVRPGQMLEWDAEGHLAKFTDEDARETVSRSVFLARHAGPRSGGMGTESDDIGPCESTRE